MASRVAPDLKTQEEVTGLCLRKEHHVQPEHSLELPVSFLFLKRSASFHFMYTVLLRGKPTRDHTDTLKVKKKVFIAGQRLRGELIQIMQP